MDLVEIRSHGANDRGVGAANTPKAAQEESKERAPPAVIREEVKGFALTVKESYSDNIIKICHHVRPATFLSSTATADEERPIVCAGMADQLVIVSDEAALISAIDQK